MSGLVEIIGHAGLRLAGTAVLRAALRWSWPRLKSLTAVAKFIELIRRFWPSTRALLLAVVVASGFMGPAFVGHGGRVWAASAKTKPQQPSPQTAELNQGLKHLQQKAKDILQQKKTKVNAPSHKASTAALRLKSLGKKDATMPAALERRQHLLTQLAATMGVTLDVERQTQVRIPGLSVKKSKRWLTGFTEYLAMLLATVVTVWLLWHLRGYVGKAVAALPVKVLGAGVLATAALALAMEYANLTFSTAMIGGCVVGATGFLILFCMEEA